MATHPPGAGPPRGGGPSEAMPPPSHDGSVVLDIGDGIGALVIYVEPDRDGQEIEVSLCAGGPRVHSAVRRRELSAGAVYAAVLPALPAGRYDVFAPERPGHSPVTTVCVPSAGVAELHWESQRTGGPNRASGPAGTPHRTRPPGGTHSPRDRGAGRAQVPEPPPGRA